MEFRDPAEHLGAELERLTLLLHREILRLRATYQLSLDEFRGLCVSDEQVDRLVTQFPPSSGFSWGCRLAIRSPRASCGRRRCLTGTTCRSRPVFATDSAAFRGCFTTGPPASRRC